MEWFTTEPIEALKGHGKVFLGDVFIADTYYDVEVYGRFQNTEMLAGHTTHTLLHKEITIALSEVIPGAIDDKFTLHTNDNRKLDFNVDGSTVTNAGDLY